MIRAVIFDLDGTLADTEPLHFEAFAGVLRGEGIALSRIEYFERLIAYTDRECFEIVMRQHGIGRNEQKLAQLVARKAAAYQAAIASRDLLYPGAAEFVRRCAQRFPLIIATGTLRSEAEQIMSAAGLRGLFIDVVAADDVERGKPQPDLFVTALGRFGFHLRERPPIASEECLVVEDTRAGIDAAHRAYMPVLAVAHTSPPEQLTAADVVRNSIAEIDLDDVLRELARRKS